MTEYIKPQQSYVQHLDGCVGGRCEEENMTAEPSNDSACTGYLVPADVVRAWQRNQKLLEIDRPADKNVGDKLAELERVVKRKDDDDVIPPSDKQMIVARKLGNFLTSKKTGDRQCGCLT